MQRKKRSEKSMGSKPGARCTERRFPPLERKGQRFLIEREKLKSVTTESEMKESERRGRIGRLGKVKNYK